MRIFGALFFSTECDLALIEVFNIVIDAVVVVAVVVAVVFVVVVFVVVVVVVIAVVVVVVGLQGEPGCQEGN